MLWGRRLACRASGRLLSSPVPLPPTPYARVLDPAPDDEKREINAKPQGRKDAKREKRQPRSQSRPSGRAGYALVRGQTMAPQTPHQRGGRLAPPCRPPRTSTYRAIFGKRVEIKGALRNEKAPRARQRETAGCGISRTRTGARLIQPRPRRDAFLNPIAASRTAYGGALLPMTYANLSLRGAAAGRDVAIGCRDPLRFGKGETETLGDAATRGVQWPDCFVAHRLRTARSSHLTQSECHPQNRCRTRT